jgi:tetratricopeptide (TPR) repeat protein
MARAIDRSTNFRRSDRQNAPKAALIISTALASMALAGCTASAAPRAETSFSKAQAALEAGKTDQAIAHAEAAVLAEPRNPGFRALLGAAYLEAGRFEAAATSFDDALELGDTDPRTTLSYALAAIAIGDSAKAIAALEARENSINPADFGLALALAGKPEQGIHVLTNALRGGQNTAKMRQNLAYTYALAGNWRAARVMMAEDVPADQIDARLSEWAADSKPEDAMKRVAKLLGVSPAPGGQPRALALVNFPSQEALVAEAATQADTFTARELDEGDLAEAQPTQTEELTFAIGGAGGVDSDFETIDPTVANILRATSARTASVPVPTVADATASAPVSAPAQVAASGSGSGYVSRPVVQTLPSQGTAPRRVADAPAAPRPAAKPAVQPVAQPAAKPAPKPTQRTAAASPKSDKAANTHLVQLGSYSTREEAKRGWAALQSKFPQLREHDLVITKAQVNGKIYYRVAAAGFGPRSAQSMCSTIKSGSRSCFAYAASNPPKGAIDNGTRVASRSR